MPYSQLYVDVVPYYNLTDINDYGKPELYGVEFYGVIDDCYDMVLGSWTEEMRHAQAVRKIHHYERLPRFKNILKCLLGTKSFDFNVLDFTELDLRPDYVWKSMRKCLKTQKATRFYNSIPALLNFLHYPYKLHIYHVEKVLNDFQRISWWFDTKKWDCTYFPNMRYIALKLLLRHGAVMEYHIPLLLTSRKLPLLERLWEEFEGLLNKNGS